MTSKIIIAGCVTAVGIHNHLKILPGTPMHTWQRNYGVSDGELESVRLQDAAGMLLQPHQSVLLKTGMKCVAECVRLKCHSCH